MKRKKIKFKLRLLPWYWKTVLTVVLCAIASLGAALFTSDSDLGVVCGFVLLAGVFWLVANTWYPKK